jgi:hypothetical protein
VKSDQSARRVISTAIDHLKSRSTGGWLHIVFVNSDIHSYRFCSLYPKKPAWQHGAKVRTDHTDQRNIELRVGHFRIQFEQFRYSPSVNLQLLKIENRSRGGFASGQWLCCSSFTPIDHSSPQNLLTLGDYYHLFPTLGSVFLWKAVCSETGLYSLGRGQRRRAGNGTSPVPYFIRERGCRATPPYALS